MFSLPKAKFSVPLSAALDEYFQDMLAARRSPRTISDYSVTYRYFTEFIEGDPLIGDITKQDISGFMQFMAKLEKPPKGVAPRPAGKRSAKTLRNYHTGLSSLWTWAIEQGYATDHIVRQVKAPKVSPKPIEPFISDEIVRMVDSCKTSRPWHNKPFSQNERFTGLRDMAIILLLIETGARRSELLNITMDDIDINRRRILIRHGKGNKDRYVSFGNIATKAVRNYLQIRPTSAKKHGDFLIVNLMSYKGQQMSGGSLSKLLQRIGKKAGVPNVYPHRFRHTAAIQRLQNGMNAYQLKEFLGHADIASTIRYVNLASIDMEPIWRKTSPIDNLKL